MKNAQRKKMNFLRNKGIKSVCLWGKNVKWKAGVAVESLKVHTRSLKTTTPG